VEFWFLIFGIIVGLVGPTVCMYMAAWGDPDIPGKPVRLDQLLQEMRAAGKHARPQARHRL
jgi:hypothetical protein